MKEYSMYTDQGNVVAGRIVELVGAAGLNWTECLSLMRFVASQRPDQYGELMDTAVREVVYDDCKFDTAFYI